jgi:ankyrin repeat protein
MKQFGKHAAIVMVTVTVGFGCHKPADPRGISYTMDGAIRRDDTSHVRYLIREGIAINYLKPTPALSRAVLHEKADILRLLLTSGANPNITDLKQGATPLHYAAMIGRVDFVTLLVEHGADINAQSSERLYTPLHIAYSRSQTNAVSVLIALGANTNLIDRDGFRPYQRDPKEAAKIWRIRSDLGLGKTEF